MAGENPESVCRKSRGEGSIAVTNLMDHNPHGTKKAAIKSTEHSHRHTQITRLCFDSQRKTRLSVRDYGIPDNFCRRKETDNFG